MAKRRTTEEVEKDGTSETTYNLKIVKTIRTKGRRVSFISMVLLQDGREIGRMQREPIPGILRPEAELFIRDAAWALSGIVRDTFH